MPSRDKKYLSIGLFVLLGFLLLAGGAILFGGGSIFAKKAYFETYFDTSVQGMDVGSAVKLRGVKIGSVESITFANAHYGEQVDLSQPLDPELRKALTYVRVLCAIDLDKHPNFTEERLKSFAEHGLIARQGSQGITGIVFVDLDFLPPQTYAEKKATFLPVRWEPDTLYIPSVPNTLQNFVDILQSISTNLKRVDFATLSEALTHLSTTIDTSIADADIPNVAHQLSEMITKMTALTVRFSDALAGIDGKTLGADIHTIASELAATTATLHEALPKLTLSTDKTLNEATAVLSSLNGLTHEISAMLSALKQKGTIADAEDSINALSRIAAQLEAFVEEIRERPSRLIFDDDEY